MEKDLINLLGLVLNVLGSIILVKYLFISDKEIEDISEIPIEPSTTHFTSATSRKTLSGALTDVEKINRYRGDFIRRRRDERTNGKRGIYLVIVGFIIQAVALFI
ncbi:MAG: hypothetical protein WCS89_01065 [Candidatus Paceibacterota bacterium]|jgi:hypothetical protein